MFAEGISLGEDIQDSWGALLPKMEPRECGVDHYLLKGFLRPILVLRLS